MILDNDQLNDEVIAKSLCEIIRRETSKPDNEADEVLVDECEKTLLSLSSSASFSEEELKEKLKKIVSEEKKENDSQYNKRFRLIRRTVVVVACVALLFIGSVITVYAFVPSFQNFVREVLNIKIGNAVEIDGVTFINNGESKIYSTLDELLESEGLNEMNIIFPKELPQEMMISKLQAVYSESGVNIVVIFVDSGVSMNIEYGISIDLEDIIDSSEKVEINGMPSYIRMSEYDGRYNSVTSYGTCVYYITADNKNKIITILKNMNLED